MDINEEISIDFFKKADNNRSEMLLLGGFFMKEKILILLIAVLGLIALAVGAYVLLVPTVDPNAQVVYKENKLFEKLEIEREVKSEDIARVFFIRNYEDKLEPNEINNIDNLRYYILDNNAKGHMLILPYNIGGKITVTKLKLNEINEKYVPSNAEDAILINEEITKDYALLLKYDRATSVPQYQIKITQGDKIATYNIEPIGGAGRVSEYEHIQRDNEKGVSKYTQYRKDRDMFEDEDEDGQVEEDLNVDEKDNNKVSEKNDKDISKNNKTDDEEESAEIPVSSVSTGG